MKGYGGSRKKEVINDELKWVIFIPLLDLVFNGSFQESKSKNSILCSMNESGFWFISISIINLNSYLSFNKIYHRNQSIGR